MDFFFPTVHFLLKGNETDFIGKTGKQIAWTYVNFEASGKSSRGLYSWFPQQLYLHRRRQKGRGSPWKPVCSRWRHGNEQQGWEGVCCQQAAPLYMHTSRSLPTVITSAVRRGWVQSISTHLYTSSSHHRERGDANKMLPPFSFLCPEITAPSSKSCVIVLNVWERVFAPSLLDWKPLSCI